MRVLYAINGLISGGAEKLISQLLPMLKNKKADCYLLVLSLKNQRYYKYLLDNGINIIEMPQNLHGIIRKYAFIKKIVLELNPDIIHCHLFPTFYYFALLRFFHKKDVGYLIMTEHNTDNKRRHKKILKPMEKFIYSNYSCVASINCDTKDALIKWLSPHSLEKYIVVENGIDLDCFRNATPYKKEDIFNHCVQDAVYICMVGSFTEQKNHLFALDVLELLPSNFYLVLVGEGELKEKIISKSNELNIKERIIFLGYRDDVSKIMKTCDVFLLPSKWEGFGLVAVEALASKLPVVCSNVIGLSSVVGDSAVLIYSFDCTRYADAIYEVSMDKNKRESLILKGEQMANKYDIKNTFDKYYEIYDKAIRTNKNR